ncbi:hypothetical protein KR52_08655 [Synechococcus sp. KORDI-52]|nr:hypothetical protein KR52_08655 [Synechococcus sp. KORDI-52]
MGWHQGNSMDDVRLQRLLQEAEDHLRSRSCRQRYERAVVRLPDSRRGIWFGDDKRSA